MNKPVPNEQTQQTTAFSPAEVFPWIATAVLGTGMLHALWHSSRLWFPSFDIKNPATFGQTDFYYGDKPAGFPSEYKNKPILGLNGNYQTLQVAGDGSCWMRSWIRATFHQIFQEDALFAQFIYQIENSHTLLLATPFPLLPQSSLQHPANQIEQMVALLQYLKTMPDEERIATMNHQKIDTFLDVWFRYLLAAVEYRFGVRNWKPSLTPKSWSGIPSQLNGYFKINVIHIQSLHPYTGSMFLNHEPIGIKPILYNSKNEIICILVNNHYENLYRTNNNHPFPNVQIDPSGNLTWSSITPELIHSKTFQDTIIKRQGIRFSKEPPVYFNPLLPILTLKTEQEWTKLKENIQRSKTFGDAFLQENPIDAAIAIIGLTQSQPSQQEQEEIISNVLFQRVWERYLERVAQHHGIAKNTADWPVDALQALLK